MLSSFWMDRALSLARRAEGQTAPNPAVGAVLVRDGRLLGEGWHRGPGQPHAETEAVEDARRRGHHARGATLWVTLEPCCHQGLGKRTPPCAPRLIEEGVAEVRAAVADPNPLVSGRGKALLEAAGVRFFWGPREEEGRDLIADFTAWMVHRRPLVTLKWAQSLEGRLAFPTPEGPWITGREARAEGHRLRAAHDAVAVGAGTLRTDNPSLLVREVPSPRPSVRRLIFAGHQPLPETAQVFTDAQADQTWLVVRPGSPAVAQARLLTPGRNLLWDGRDFVALGQTLLEAGFYRVLVEGGPTLLASFLGAGFWDRAAVFTAPRLLGLPSGPGCLSSPLAVAFDRPRWRSVGSDLLIEGANPEAVCSPA